MRKPDPRTVTLVWDEDEEGGNAAHIAAHRVSPSECEEIRRGLPDIKKDTRAEHASTWTFIGRTEGGRKLQVSLRWVDEEEDTMRVVTAFEKS